MVSSNLCSWFWKPQFQKVVWKIPFFAWKSWANSNTLVSLCHREGQTLCICLFQSHSQVYKEWTFCATKPKKKESEIKNVNWGINKHRHIYESVVAPDVLLYYFLWTRFGMNQKKNTVFILFSLSLSTQSFLCIAVAKLHVIYHHVPRRLVFNFPIHVCTLEHIGSRLVRHGVITRFIQFVKHKNENTW